MSEILMVGGRPAQARTLEQVLAPLGFAVATAASSREALGLLGKREFALVVTESADEHRLLEAQAAERRVPVVLLDAGRGESETDTDRLALKRSEALLRGAFEAAPIGKTVLDDAHRIVRTNRAFALLLDRMPTELLGIDIASLARPDDGGKLTAALTRVAEGDVGPDAPDRSGFDVHLRSSSGSYAWTCAYLSSIDPTEFGEPLLMIQWVDLSPHRHAEQA
ncbi:MAG: PAS domain S-box protein, partial [Actinomycetota bacterium]|nr:PAS domain S-box protein [Actinomycetota bacterium]